MPGLALELRQPQPRQRADFRRIGLPERLEGGDRCGRVRRLVRGNGLVGHLHRREILRRQTRVASRMLPDQRLPDPDRRDRGQQHGRHDDPILPREQPRLLGAQIVFNLSVDIGHVDRQLPSERRGP
jgi:hypothetical protein